MDEEFIMEMAVECFKIKPDTAVEAHAEDLLQAAAKIKSSQWVDHPKKED